MDIVDKIKTAFKISQEFNNLDLKMQLLDIQSDAVSLKEEILKLREENVELKRIKDIEERIIRHKKGYITLQGDDEEIWYCSVCWGLHNKLVQLFDNGYCQACSIAHGRRK